MRTLALTIGLSAAAAAYAQAPGSPEIALNTTTFGDQVSPAIAVESDGGFVVVWRSGFASIVARRLDSRGTPRSAELPVNFAGAANDARPVVAAYPGGGFVVAWHAPDASGQGIFLRSFDAAGVPIGGAVPVNINTGGNQVSPQIAGGPLGYVVTWTSGPNSVVGRLLSGNGTPLGGEIAVGTGISPAVSWRGNGIVFAWTPMDLNGSVLVRLYDAGGAPLAPATVANGANPPMPCCLPEYIRQGIRIVEGPAGAFTVAWDLYGWSHLGGLAGSWWMQYGSFVRRYDGTGAPIGGQTQVNVYTQGAQQDPSVGTAAGRTLVAWTSLPTLEGIPPPPSPQDGNGAGVYARLFDAAGNDVGGGEFRVNATTVGNQSLPAVAMTDTGAVIAYQSPDAAGLGIYARRLLAVTASGFEVDPTDEPQSDGNRVFENGETVVVAPAWRNTTGSARALTSTAMGFGGLAGPTYSIVDATADFGVIADGATRSCRDTGNCFLFSVSGVRPTTHWDTYFTEYGTPSLLFAPRAAPCTSARASTTFRGPRPSIASWRRSSITP